MIKIIDGKKEELYGSCNVRWEITKELMKERYNYDWVSPQDKHSDWNID